MCEGRCDCASCEREASADSQSGPSHWEGGRLRWEALATAESEVSCA